MQSQAEANIEFVPARWWEAVSFIRFSLDIMRGVGDPWVDQILARPWSFSSLLEYSYMLHNFFRFDNFFVVVSGQRAGLLSLKIHPGFMYIDALGLLPQFQRGRIGMQTADFADRYRARHGCPWVAVVAAIQNKPVHMLCAAFNGYLPGLSVTTLTLAASNPSPPPVPGLEVKELDKSKAGAAWQRWRLYEVEQVAGRETLDLATHLLEPLPRGRYLALYQGDEEIGFAVARRQTVDLFPAKAFWSSAPTANLVAALARSLGTTIQRLTVTQTHANNLEPSEAFAFQRHRERERHFIVFKRV